MKRFINRLCLFSLPILVALIVVNWVGDAANIFSNSGAEYDIAKYLNEGYAVKNVYNIDERKLQRDFIRLNKNEAEVIVIGSSTIMLIGSAYSDKTLLNHGVSGCSIEDMIAIYQLYRNKGKMPRKIIMGMDAWMFNQHNGQNRWVSLTPEFNSFFNHGSAVAQGWSKYLQLISPSYFQASLKMLKKRFRAGKSSAPIPVLGNAPLEDSAARFPDGTIHYDYSYSRPSEDERNARIDSFINGNVYSLERYTEFSRDALHKFEKLMEAMRDDGVTLEFVMMPYAPKVYEFLAATPRYRNAIEYEKFVRSYAEKYNIPVTGSLDPHRFELTDQYFYDGMHLNNEGIAVVLGDRKF